MAPVLLLVAALPLTGATKASRPPHDLHKVGDHWTAYNPPDPSTWPAGSKTYTIKQGDTLWALAQRQLGNAYLWPQLWESNTWITDAHWIYPGDVLLIEGEVAR
ncbi:MAG TPA: LysM peptidoglycan-binding domain-containing protein, partial [Candidatus Solibacter sp.]|nr:LysM peptidoglycan-binding domain-containing protein [Candidatus Solibacter sp.]